VAADRSAAEDRSLVDADWRFGVTVSTDDVGRVGSTFLQMRLATLPSSAGTGSSAASAAGGGEGGEAAGSAALNVHHMELTVPQFYDLLSQLEKAKSYVEYLGASGGM
jgi:hypothetical protein